MNSRTKEAWLAMAFSLFFASTYLARFQQCCFSACPFPTPHCMTATSPPGRGRETCLLICQPGRPGMQHAACNFCQSFFNKVLVCIPPLLPCWFLWNLQKFDYPQDFYPPLNSSKINYGFKSYWKWRAEQMDRQMEWLLMLLPKETG